MPENEDNLLNEDEESVLPEGMDLDTYVEHRLALANRMEDVARAMYRLYDYWERFDLPGDFLDAERDEYPFELALEDIMFEVENAATIIRENTDDRQESASE